MKALIEFIARSLVDAPDQVQVTEVEGEQTTVLELKVAKEDLGKVIGKQGRTARAMRLRCGTSIRQPPQGSAASVPHTGRTSGQYRKDRYDGILQRYP